MNNRHSLPVGIDWFIDKIQTAGFNKLSLKWPGINYEAYGRCYRNEKDKGYVAELYTAGGEYKDAYYDDTIDALSFFGISGQITQGMGAVAQIHWLFFINLDKVKPGDFRADEEARRDVLDVIGLGLYGATINSLELWKDNVLKEYPGTRRDNMVSVDMHPKHCFRINLTLNYNPTINCNKKLK